ncbi:MAG: hypothetical protein HRT72_01030 [Flavobacteriales bacterium]|nr:hypothetical protein [Flavobacteriales bacterium]
MKKPREYVSSKDISKIDLSVGPKSIGAFLIEAINPNSGKFLPRYVGCSYDNLMGEIVRSTLRKENIGFNRYRLVETKTPQGAWALECKTYHEFKEVNNLTNSSTSEGPKKE